MMNDVGSIVRMLFEHGERVRVTCDHEGWTIEQGDRMVYRARDGRDARAFVHGLATFYLR